jgi:glutamine synthetase adenylyltransferase
MILESIVLVYGVAFSLHSIINCYYKQKYAKNERDFQIESLSNIEHELQQKINKKSNVDMNKELDGELHEELSEELKEINKQFKEILDNEQKEKLDKEIEKLLIKKAELECSMDTDCNNGLNGLFFLIKHMINIKYRNG